MKVNYIDPSYLQDGELYQFEKNDNNLKIYVAYEVYHYGIANGYRDEESTLQRIGIAFEGVSQLELTHDLIKDIQKVESKKNWIRIQEKDKYISFSFSQATIFKVYEND